jgi:radical SAM superfamily enzyme YgiQ (UPF0313 family)
MIGFTVYNTNYAISNLMAGELKEKKGLITIYGGPTPTVAAGDIMASNSAVDICVRHEGEETCLELVQELQKHDFQLQKADLSESDPPVRRCRLKSSPAESSFPGVSSLRPRRRSSD